MSSYIDHYTCGALPGSTAPVVKTAHSWAKDARQRLRWLYGDPDTRMALNAPDVARWGLVGRERAA